MKLKDYITEYVSSGRGGNSGAKRNALRLLDSKGTKITVGEFIRVLEDLGYSRFKSREISVKDFLEYKENTYAKSKNIINIKNGEKENYFKVIFDSSLESIDMIKNIGDPAFGKSADKNKVRSFQATISDLIYYIGKGM